MSRSRKIFELLQPRMPGTVVCGRLLIVKPTGYIARGFFLDTTPHKNLMKLFRVVMPLYLPGEHLTLTHSTMISGDHAALFLIDRKAYAQSAAIVLDRIYPELEFLEKLRGPSEFLSYISWKAGNRMLGVRMDFALTHYLLGNHREALTIFRGIDMDLGQYPKPTQDHFGSLIGQMIGCLEQDPPALRAVLDGWRDRKIEKLGLAESTMAPALHLVC